MQIIFNPDASIPAFGISGRIARVASAKKLWTSDELFIASSSSMLKDGRELSEKTYWRSLQELKTRKVLLFGDLPGRAQAQNGRTMIISSATVDPRLRIDSRIWIIADWLAKNHSQEPMAKKELQQWALTWYNSRSDKFEDHIEAEDVSGIFSKLIQGYKQITIIGATDHKV